MNAGTHADLSSNEYRSLASFRYLLRTYMRFSEQAAREAGLETRQYQFLLALRGLAAGEQASVSEVAELLHVRHHSAVGLVDRTAQRGLVERRIDPSNGRRVLVTLTSRGREALARLAVLHRDELRRSVPRLLEALHALARDPRFER